MKRWYLACAALFLAAATLHADDKPAAKKFRTFDTPYYILTTDLPDEAAREADLRMTRMYEEYKRRTSSFSGEPRGKFPFFLYTDRDDYVAAGAPKASAGVFMIGQNKLMAWTGDKVSDTTWHIIQHEGFHQFAASTIRLDLPAWLNEGLAEYFGEAVFAGDTFVSGCIPANRLRMIKKEIAEKKWKPFPQMLTMTLKEWNAASSYTNYNQAWAMVHYLAHGEDGKYQKAFDQYILMMNRGTQPADAWRTVFGKDVAAFQEKCEKWWSDLPDNPTSDLYAKVVVSGMTSLLARGELQKQSFDKFDELLKAAPPTDLKLSRELWLPPELVDEVVKLAPKVGTWTLEKPGKNQLPRLVCVGADVTYTGTFTLSGKRVGSVAVTMTSNAAASPATKASTNPAPSR